MRKLMGLLILMAITTTTSYAGTLLDQEFRRLASEETVNLDDAYAGKVVLVVNTASKCGNTPQY
ncbi:MAG: glutathione peroxidase, partial [Woeseiaceae bacterium]